MNSNHNIVKGGLKCQILSYNRESMRLFTMIIDQNIFSWNSVARCQHAGADRGLLPAYPPCAFCSSLPPSAQGGGEGRSVLNKCIAGHQVCPPSTVSSLWKSGPLRAASPGSPGKWYLLHHRKNVPRRSLLQPLCHLRKGERLQHGGGSDLSPSRPFPIRRIELL